jgi:hypothetical protein
MGVSIMKVNVSGGLEVNLDRPLQDALANMLLLAWQPLM